MNLELPGLWRTMLGEMEKDGILIILFKFLDPTVPEAVWPWTVSLCDTINSLFCLI